MPERNPFNQAAANAARQISIVATPGISYARPGTARNAGANDPEGRWVRFSMLDVTPLAEDNDPTGFVLSDTPTNGE